MKKKYIKDGKIKTRNQIVIKGKRTIKDKDGNDKVINTNIYNPKHEDLIADGWVEYVAPTQTEEEIDRHNRQHEKRIAKEKLQESDYKIVKCMEYFLCGKDLPYDIKALHKERDEHRKEINDNEK